MKFKIIIISLLLVSCGTKKPTHSTEKKSEKIIIYKKSNSNLISERIAKITIDNNGNIWLGTMDSGLVKFDGNNFTNFNKENSKIKGDFISDLYTDKNNNVWVSYSQPENGTIKHNNGKWTEFPNENIPNLDFDGYPIVGDKEGNVYFGGIGSNKIIKYNGIKTTEINVPNHKGQNILAIDFDENGNVVLGLTGSLMLRKDGKWKTLTEENSELKLGTVRGVKFMKNGDLFIGYGGGFGDGGFSILNDNKWKHFNKNNSVIPDHMVRDFEVDDYGNIWMATNNGLFEIKKGGLFKPFLFDKRGLGYNTIMDISIDKNNTVWLATTFGLVKIVQ